MSLDRNDLAYWYPPILDAGLPVPRTEIVRTSVGVFGILDGRDPAGWDAFMGALREAVARAGVPCFLRTGHGSGKHQWRDTCYLAEPDLLEHHVAALVEWSAMAGVFGLPAATWAVRELIPVVPICRCETYGGMPVVREFRFFASSDAVEHFQPYWPPDAVECGGPDDPAWRLRLAEISRLDPNERMLLEALARSAASRVDGGVWSVDFLQDRDGDWWLTDMAVGEDSYRYEPEVERG